MKLYLIRHGNMAGDPHAHLEAPVEGCLSETGLRQAAALGQALADIPFTHVYSSPLGRAIETAQTIVGNREVPIQIESWLEEWRPAHVMEGSDDTRFETMMAKAAAKPLEQTWKTEAGESLMQMADRIIPGIQSLLTRHGVSAAQGGFLPADPENSGVLAIVAHGGSLNVLMKYLLGCPIQPGPLFQFNETGVAVIGFHAVQNIWYPHLELLPFSYPNS